MTALAHRLDPCWSSNKDDWQTPEHILDRLRAEWGEIALDPCTALDNPTKARRYCVAPRTAFAAGITLAGTPIDGLAQNWRALARDGLIFVNPPYGRGIVGPWVEKALEAARAGYDVVLLLPNRTDQKWFQEIAALGHNCFIRGRLKFKGAKSGAPFPSILSYLGPSVLSAGRVRFRAAFGDLGVIL